MGSAASLPDVPEEVRRKSFARKDMVHGEEMLMNILREQLCKPLDASETLTLVDAQEQLKQLRFALACSTNPHIVQSDYDNSTVQHHDVLVPQFATVTPPEHHETGGFGKALDTLGVSMTEYLSKVKADKTQMFSDPNFPPNENSLAHDWESLAHPEEWRTYEWKRISSFAKKELFLDGISPMDVNQGRLGNCYFLSALAVLAENPERIHKLFHVETREISERGVYGVHLCLNGEWKAIVVDDFVPCMNDRPAFAQPAFGAEFWVLLLEKAWAKANGSYQNINGGDPSTMLQILTGAPSETIVSDDTGLVWDTLLRAQREEHVTAASIFDHPQDLQSEVGLVERHSYAILQVVEVNHQRGRVKLLKIRNPWGRFEWRGNWSDSSPLWTDALKEELNWSSKDDGVFFMELSEFVQMFSAIHINRVHDDWHYCSSPETSFNNLTTKMEDLMSVGKGLSPNNKTVLKLHVPRDGNATLAIHQVDQRSLHSTSDSHGYVSMRFWLIALPSAAGKDSFANILATPRMAYFTLDHDTKLYGGDYLLCVEGIGGVEKDKFVASCYSEMECKLEVLHSPTQHSENWLPVQQLFLDAFENWTRLQGEIHSLANHGAPNIEFRTWRSPVNSVTCLLYENKDRLFPSFSNLQSLSEIVTLSLFNMRLAFLGASDGGVADVVQGSNSDDPAAPTSAQLKLQIKPGQKVFIVLEQSNTEKGFKAEYKRQMQLENV